MLSPSHFHSLSHPPHLTDDMDFDYDSSRGLIGPTRQFGGGSIYNPQLYALVIGALLPIPFWYWQRKYPNRWNKFISTPVVLNAVTYIPPATGINYSSWFAVGFLFQYFIRRKNFAWWSKFNYVTAAAMDSGECFFFFPLLNFFGCRLWFSPW